MTKTLKPYTVQRGEAFNNTQASIAADIAVFSSGATPSKLCLTFAEIAGSLE
jgi:hypothetical protein